MSRLPDMNAALAAIAARIGCSLDELHRAASTRPFHLAPGVTVEGEHPLPLGSIVNLRRQMPGGIRAQYDKRWVVSGYRQNSSGRWMGYTIHRGAFCHESGLLSKSEAFDVVERYEVPGT